MRSGRLYYGMWTAVVEEERQKKRKEKKRGV